MEPGFSQELHNLVLIADKKVTIDCPVWKQDQKIYNLNEIQNLILVWTFLSWVWKPRLSTCNLGPSLEARSPRPRRMTPSIGLWRDNYCSSRPALSLPGTSSGASQPPAQPGRQDTSTETSAGRGWGWRAATTSTDTGIKGTRLLLVFLSENFNGTEIPCWSFYWILPALAQSQ